MTRTATINNNAVDERSGANMYQRGMNRLEAKGRLFGLLDNSNKIMLRKGTVDEARLNKKSIEKMLSGESVRGSTRNGFTAEQHFAAAAGIVELYNEALKLIERPDKSGQPDVFIHRYGTPLGFGGVIAFITVKESTEHGKKVHDIELMEIKKLGGILADERTASRERPSAPSSHVYDDNVLKLEFTATSKITHSDSKVNTQTSKK